MWKENEEPPGNVDFLSTGVLGIGNEALFLVRGKEAASACPWGSSVDLLGLR